MAAKEGSSCVGFYESVEKTLEEKHTPTVDTQHKTHKSGTGSTIG